MKTPNEVIEDWLISTWARDRKLGDLAVEALKDAGYVIVPVEPTSERVEAGIEADIDYAVRNPLENMADTKAYVRAGVLLVYQAMTKVSSND